MPTRTNIFSGLFSRAALRRFVRIINWWHEGQKDQVMYVKYDLTKDELITYNWISHEIPIFSGKFSLKKFRLMKEWCNDRTSIYIWAGMKIKHLAYNDPIKRYFEDESLLRTGIGYKFGKYSPARWHDIIWNGREEQKCKSCGHVTMKPIVTG